MAVKPKLNEDGAIVLSPEGNPIYVWEDGKEAPVDVDSMFTKIGQLNNESKENRLRAESAEGQLGIFKERGIEDIPAYLTDADKAMETVKNLDQKQLVDAGEVQRVKDEAAEAWKEKLGKTEQGYKEQIEKLTTKIAETNEATRQLVIRGIFDRSRYLSDETFLDPDVAFSHFGRFFHIEGSINDGFKIYATRPNGEKIFSRERPGEYATPEEALEVLINESPGRDRYIKNLASGSGAGTVQSGPSGKVLTLSKEEAKNPATYRAAKEKAAKEGLQLQIT